jgi:hypothetical protein
MPSDVVFSTETHSYVPTRLSAVCATAEPNIPMANADAANVAIAVCRFIASLSVFVGVSCRFTAGG